MALAFLDAIFGIVTLIAIIISLVYVFKDSKKINEFKRAKVIDGTDWVILCILVWILFLPWYIFASRESALKKVPAQVR